VCSATAWFAMQVDVTFQWMIIMAWLVAYVLMMIGVVKLARQYA